MSLEVLTRGGGGATASIFVTGLAETDTVSASKGGKTVHGVWTESASGNGHLMSGIKEHGTWTVTATNGTKTVTQDVLVDAALEFEIAMSYVKWLYNEGDECEDVTGGWGSIPMTGITNLTTATKESNRLAFQEPSWDQSIGTVNAVDVTNYTSIIADIDVTGTSPNHPFFGISPTHDAGAADRVRAYPTSTGRQTLTIDLTNVSGMRYVWGADTATAGKGYIYAVWLE